jgi:transcription initiation factor IIE alpha subunit
MLTVQVVCNESNSNLDVVKFSKNIEKKDEHIVDLKEKIFRLKKALSNMEEGN